MVPPEAPPLDPRMEYAPGPASGHGSAALQPKSKARVVAIALVVALLFIVPVVYLMFSGLGPASTGLLPTAIIRGGGSWASNSTVTTYTFAVVSVLPEGGRYKPSDLMFIASDSQQTPLYWAAGGETNSTGGFEISVAFSDEVDVGAVSAGDHIKISVSPVANNPLVGGRLQINYNSVSMGTGEM